MTGFLVNIFLCFELMNVGTISSVELEKQSFCDLKVANNTEHHVAFKVITSLIVIIDLDYRLSNEFCIFCIWLTLNVYFSITRAIGQNDLAQEVLCASQHRCCTALGFLHHKRS